MLHVCYQHVMWGFQRLATSGAAFKGNGDAKIDENKRKKSSLTMRSHEGQRRPQHGAGAGAGTAGLRGGGTVRWVAWLGSGVNPSAAGAADTLGEFHGAVISGV